MLGRIEPEPELEPEPVLDPELEPVPDLDPELLLEPDLEPEPEVDPKRDPKTGAVASITGLVLMFFVVFYMLHWH
jgi:hypothetical protein